MSHIIFDAQIAGGHTVDALAAMTCASIVSRETVRTALTMAALNDLAAKKCKGRDESDHFRRLDRWWSYC